MFAQSSPIFQGPCIPHCGHLLEDTDELDLSGTTHLEVVLRGVLVEILERDRDVEVGLVRHGDLGHRDVHVVLRHGWRLAHLLVISLHPLPVPRDVARKQQLVRRRVLKIRVT